MEIFGEIHETVSNARYHIQNAAEAWAEGRGGDVKTALGQARERLETALREVTTYYRFLAGPEG